jgi:signal transduction histidine kinase/ligand-binding sensor domain-containing protein
VLFIAARLTFCRAFLGCGLVFFALTAVAGPDDWFARVWQTDDGLPDNDVRALTQTADEYLWVATDSGISRFDGARFEKFRLTNIGTNRNNIIEKLMVDSRHQLWVALNRGAVVCIGQERSQVFTSENGLPDSHALSLVEDHDGNIWVPYINETDVIRIGRDGAITKFGVKDGLPNVSNAAWMTLDAGGQLWFAKGRSLGVFRNGKFETLTILPNAANRFIAARDGGVWLFTLDAKLYRFREGGQLEDHGGLPTGSGPTVLFVDHSGTLWIGTVAYGLFRLEETGLKAVSTSHREVTALAEDREGNMWVGTGGGGLNRLRPKIVEIVGSETGAPFESVSSVCKDAGGSLWVVTRNGLVIRQQGTNWIDMSSASNWPGGHCLSVIADRTGAVWIGTRNFGLNRFQNGAYTNWRRGRGLVADGVRSLLVASNGDVWATFDFNSTTTAGFSSGLQRFRDGQWRSFEVPPSTHILRAMAEDRNGDIWLGSADGQLFRVSGDRLFNESARTPANSTTIRCLTATEDGSLWIGYAGQGVGRLKDGHYATVNSARGLADDYICQVLDDGHGWLWFGGDKGIFKVRRDELIDVAEKSGGRVRSVLYKRGEGVPGLQLVFESCPNGLREADGRLWMATRLGLAVIHTASIHDNTDPPAVLIERVVANGETVAAYQSLATFPGTPLSPAVDLRRRNATFKLPPNHRRLEISFTALSFTAPENVEFKYRLDGVDDDWVEAGSQRTVAYPQLTAGEYRFHVKACNDSGIWNDAGATLGFSVLPFFWQTWPFRLTVVTAFTLTVIAIVRYVSFRRLRRQVRLLQEQAALHKERARIAKDIHDDLGASLTHIALLGDLAREDIAVPRKAGEHVQKISSTARQVMKSLDEIVWAVNPSNDTLNHVIDYIGQFTWDYLRVAGIRCRLDLPENPPERNIPADTRHNLFLVIKEALNNVVKHAAATEVWLRVSIASERLEVIVEDNGRGFDQPPRDAWADGLRNMRNRLSDIGGECRIESRAGAGTKITLEIPWQRN